MKNAVDLLYPEWNHKAAGFVGYGFDGATRAVEQWRSILAAVVMFTVRSQVALQNFADWKDGEFAPGERRAGRAERASSTRSWRPRGGPPAARLTRVSGPVLA